MSLSTLGLATESDTMGMIIRKAEWAVRETLLYYGIVLVFVIDS